MSFIDCKMQFAPGTPGRDIVFFLVPFVFAVDLESGGINNHETTRCHRFGQDMPGQGNAALGNAAEVRNGGVSFHDTGKRIHDERLGG